MERIERVYVCAFFSYWTTGFIFSSWFRASAVDTTSFKDLGNIDKNYIV